MFFHAGEGEVFGNGKWSPVRPGSAVFMPPNEEHQVRNTGKGNPDLCVFDSVLCP